MSNTAIKKRANKQTVWLRRSIQIFFFFIILLIVVNHSLEESGRGIEWIGSPSLHAVCPFGGVVSIYQFVTQGNFTKKIHESSFVLMIIVFALTIVFGPVFCGWVCPMGSLQEWLASIGKKIFKKRYNHFIPYSFDRWLRYLRYAVLVWVLIMTAQSGQLFFQEIDPYYALFNFWTGEVALTGFIVLGVVLLLSLFVERPFCKYACPYGAVLGVFNLFRIFGIKRNTATCIDCRACDKACPMNITVSNKKSIRDHQCISCLKCGSEQSCPVENTVEMSIKKITQNREEIKG
jgi:polyferredoxin